MAEFIDPAPRHGGDLAFATARYGAPAAGWLDLSTGINPRPYPAPPVLSQDLSRLPDRDALSALVASGRGVYGVPAEVPLIATPGSEIALRLLPLVAPEGGVGIVSPTYPSHGEAWANAGRPVVRLAGTDAVADEVSVVVVTNPNNPDGRAFPPRRLAELAAQLGRRGGLLVVDEAFADLAPEASLIPRLAGLPAVVLRSFGKFFGLPGLRFGFVVGAEGCVARLEALLGDWPVSGPAIAIGKAALADTQWRDETRQQLARDAARLRSLLAGHGLAVVGGTDLFVLCATPDTGALHRRLGERGIWTRAFAEERTWLRFGLPADDSGFARLDRALAEITAPAAPAVPAASVAR